MAMQTAIVELDGKTFECRYNFIPADHTTGLGPAIEPFWIYLVSAEDPKERQQDCFDLVNEWGLWPRIENLIWQQIEGNAK